MKIFAIYKGDDYLFDGTLRELSLKTGMFEDYIERVLTQEDRITNAINCGTYDNLYIAVEVEIDDWEL